MHFRNKNFIQFLARQKLYAGTWIMFLFGSLLAVGVSLMDFNNNRFPVGGIFLFLGAIGLHLFFNWGSFMMYKKAHKIVHDFGNGDSILLENIPCYIKNFDLFSEKSKFTPKLNKTIYYFNKADLLITTDRIFLFGKSKSFMMYGFAAPVELYFMGEPYYTNSAQIISLKELNNSRIEIIIQDPNYKNNIMLQFEPKDKLKQGLSNLKF